MKYNIASRLLTISLIPKTAIQLFKNKLLIGIIFSAHQEDDIKATQKRFRHDTLQVLRQRQAPWKT